MPQEMWNCYADQASVNIPAEKRTHSNTSALVFDPC